MAYQLDVTNRFKRAYKKLPPEIQTTVDSALILLAKGKPYPKGLRVKKMSGHDFVFEASPNMAIRITFHFVNPDYIVLRNVGPHDITLSNP